MRNMFNNLSAKRRRNLGAAAVLGAFVAMAGVLTYGKLTTNSDFVPFSGELRNDVQMYRDMLQEPENRALYETLIAENRCYILKRPHEEACKYYKKRGMDWPAHAKVGV